MKTKWYQKNWFVILMLLFVFPVGLFLMWYFKKWNKPTRWILTAVIALFVLISPFVDTNEEENTETKSGKTVKKENKDSDNDEIKKKEIKKTSKKAEKTKKSISKDDKAMSTKEYDGIIRSYQAQIQLVGEDLVKLESEINDDGKTTTKGSDLLYAISGSLETSSIILNGAENEVVPPSKFEQDHKNLNEADSHFQNAAKQINDFEETGNPEDLNNALDQMQEGTDIADISIRNILEN